MKSFEDKLKQIKEEIDKEAEHGMENVGHLRGFLENDIPKLHERLQIEMQEREEQDNMIIQKTSEELTKLQEGVTLAATGRSSPKRRPGKRLRKPSLT
jgi:hypothetical protein